MPCGRALGNELRMDPKEKNPWTLQQRKQVYSNNWIAVFEDDVLRPDGKPGIYGLVHFKNRAVGVAAVDDQGRVLLVGQYRYPLDCYSWEIPEGGAPAGEDVFEAAKRELLEETGCSAAHWKLVLRAHLSNSVSDEESFSYLATGLSAGEASPEGTEELQLKWAPFPEAIDMIFRGEITDALSILTLQTVALTRRELMNSAAEQNAR